MSSNGDAQDAGMGIKPDVGRGRVEVPGAVVDVIYSPTSSDEVAEVVRQVAREEAGLLICGGHTRLHCANRARDISIGLSLEGMSGIREFEPEEGVIHVAAGTPIHVIQEAANAEGWELALDPPGATSTLGGTIASAATGPRSHAFGRVADVVLGLDVVGADAVQSKCGGRVVKNVTGYDMAKLYCGSFGSLAVICGAWLRLRPRPPVREAYSTNLDPTGSHFELVRGKGRGATVRALVWTQSPGVDGAKIVVEFAGSAEGVAHDREHFSSGLNMEAVPLLQVDALRDARSGLGSEPIAMRVRVLASKCGEMKQALLDLGFSVSVDPGLGVIHARGVLDHRSDLLEIRRRAGGLGGLAFFENIPDAWRDDVDVFDDQADGASAGLRLKDRFDPARTLNPGRFAGRA